MSDRDRERLVEEIARSRARVADLERERDVEPMPIAEIEAEIIALDTILGDAATMSWPIPVLRPNQRDQPPLGALQNRRSRSSASVSTFIRHASRAR